VVALGLTARAVAATDGATPAAGLAAAAGAAAGCSDEPRQNRSSQLRDSRIALRIRPAIE
jgi:hypothetical protein